jgi:hypothetical protein
MIISVKVEKRLVNNWEHYLHSLLCTKKIREAVKLDNLSWSSIYSPSESPKRYFLIRKDKGEYFLRTAKNPKVEREYLNKSYDLEN